MSTHTDQMILRLEREIEERNALMEGIVGSAQDHERDLTESEKEQSLEARKRIEVCEEQLDTLYESRNRVASARKRANDVSRELTKVRRQADDELVEFRSAGEYLVESIKAHNGNRDSQERLEVFYRDADHQRTDDNPGVIPDPIVGPVINFIDAARPIVGSLGVQPLPTGTFHRPKVTQHTAVARQTNADTDESNEKVELTSQKMLLTRNTVNADTYGGYVNVSRQNIDFSSPQVMDLIINDLAAQYAIVTEAATADVLATTSATAVEYPLVTGNDFTQEALAGALWDAAATVFTATQGEGRLVLAVAPDRLKVFGPLFAPVNPQNAQGDGFNAGRFGQGIMGNISGIEVVMSAGLGSGEAFLYSTAAVEVWEQRVGMLQVVEPSVLGVQVAYAGYFASLLVENNGIVPLEEGTA